MNCLRWFNPAYYSKPSHGRATSFLCALVVKRRHLLSKDKNQQWNFLCILPSVSIDKNQTAQPKNVLTATNMAAVWHFLGLRWHYVDGWWIRFWEDRLHCKTEVMFPVSTQKCCRTPAGEDSCAPRLWGEMPLKAWHKCFFCISSWRNIHYGVQTDCYKKIMCAGWAALAKHDENQFASFPPDTIPEWDERDAAPL